MPKVTIDGIEIEVEQGTSVMQAAESLGIEIPKFCTHDKLSIAGNCRMCLVEITPGPPKPASSCTMPCADGMDIKTNSKMVRDARAGVMEMMLINHPLDCPVCDQGGECDLQDQAVGYGAGKSRFTEEKRIVENKDFGALIKTVMTRCINCTRCIRFAQEIAGVPEIGQMNRGEDAEIEMFVDAAGESELSGNLIDICPVGALTSKPYAFKARSWELSHTNSIDIMDGLGSNIRIDSFGREVMRVLPRENADINDVWISDKTRFACDGLAENRIDRPWMRNPKTEKLEETSWEDAIAAIVNSLNGLNGGEIGALAGDLCDLESIVALGDLMDTLQSANRDCRVDGALFDTTQRSGWLMNSGISGVDKADAILLVATNPRQDATMLNARIFKAWRDRKVPIALIGQQADLPYPFEHLGDATDAIEKLSRARTGFAKILKSAEKPMLIAGQDAFTRPDGAAIHYALAELAQNKGFIRDGWNGFNMLHNSAARVGALEAGFTPKDGGMDFAQMIKSNLKALILLGAEVSAPNADFVVYIGHHGDIGASGADVVLPSCAYTEKTATYVNTQGRPQLARKAVDAPNTAREDWKIISDIAKARGHELPYDSASSLSDRISQSWPHLAQYGAITPAQWGMPKSGGVMQRTPFAKSKINYYQTNVICRSSETMGKCQKYSHST